MKNKEPFSAERTIYFDYLRVFATFAVMIIHISAQNWYTTNVNSFDWQVFNFYDSIVRWGVPVFVMISGALFLNRNISPKLLYTKYILRMIISYIVWSVIYAFCSNSITFERILTGHYHLWFIPMIIGIYMCIPMIKPMIQDDNITNYFLILAFTFSFTIPTLTVLVNDFGKGTIVGIVNTIQQTLNNMNLYLVLGFVSYFILGYYIHKTDLNNRQRFIIYGLGILGFVSTIILSLVVSLKIRTGCTNYYENFSINVLFESLAVFTWFKHKKFTNKSVNSLIQKLSKYSFGAYLIHDLIITELNSQIGLNTLSFHPVFSVIAIGIIVFIISFAISAFLNQIPIIKKYIV